MYDENGFLVWDCTLDIYGRTKLKLGTKTNCPFRWQGQYEDVELEGLYYNRFRYYDSNSGLYISKDPIGLKGGFSLYSYVKDANTYVDIFGWEDIIPTNLVGFGKRDAIRLPRPNIDIDVDANGMVKSQKGIEFPQGASTFKLPEQAPLTGHYHNILEGTQLPEGLGVKADGIDVNSSSVHGKGHHTIYPTTDMSFSEFQKKFSEIPSEYGGKKQVKKYP